MNSAKYLFIVAVAVLGLVFWGGRSFANSTAWVEGTVEGGFSQNSFTPSQLIGYRLYSPVYLGDLGQITDFLVDRCDGRVAFAVVSDTPGFGSDFAIVPFEAIERTGEHTFQVIFRGKDAPIAYYHLDLKGDRFAQYMEDNRRIIGLSQIPATIDLAWADSVYRFYGVTPYWTAASLHPEFVSYRMSGRTDEFAFRFPDGRLIVSSYGVAPYWTTCTEPKQ